MSVLLEVTVQGIQKSIEKIKIRSFLDTVDSLFKCPGLKDDSNIDLKTSQGYRFFSSVIINGKPQNSSIIRAHGCSGGVHSLAMCDACTRLHSLLSMKVVKNVSVLHPKTPLKHVSQTTLIKQVKVMREENRRLQSLVASLSKGNMKAEINEQKQVFMSALQ